MVSVAAPSITAGHFASRPLAHVVLVRTFLPLHYLPTHYISPSSHSLHLLTLCSILGLAHRWHLELARMAPAAVASRVLIPALEVVALSTGFAEIRQRIVVQDVIRASGLARN
jgi:hypothetical protein